MSLVFRRPTVSRLLLGTACIVAALTLAARSARTAVEPAAQDTLRVPAPVIDGARGAMPPATAILAGGCFWGVQGVYQHTSGVLNAVSGYAGGAGATAHYDIVGLGTTGHAESVLITFDPNVVSYGHLLQIFFSVVHDPTQLNRQGPDYGTQYRSAIFPVNADQAEVAKAYIAQLNQAHVFSAPIVTKIEPDRVFYPAEDYHQDFLTLNPRYPYIVINDLPKIEDLKRLFPQDYRDKPVLVGKTRDSGPRTQD
jgi:peptide-methionine (S)-S-oxide reductase